jgi:RNA polymerase-binding transcription factor DksA
MTGIAERATAPGSKTSLTSGQLTSLRSHLVVDLKQTRRLIDQLVEEMDAFVVARRDTATDDEHDPEGPTLAFERSQSSAILGQSHQHVSEIETALLRMDQGTYGLCTNCRRSIALGRLQVRPQATLCISCAGRPRGR